MWDAPAKALVRSYFYEEFLPQQLPEQLMRSGNYLTLLGDGQEELRLLTSLGVPGHRIFSVEHDPAVFTAQSLRSRSGELPVGLYFGELSEFITHYLHTNQRFLVLNLDICGAYRTSIDPVLSPILLFARRNPRTVIATYSNVGRDRPQLREGLKSLAIFSWLAPAETQRCIETLYARYRQAGLSQEVSGNMILRHLFWLRSHLEHIVLGRVSLGQIPAAQAAGFLGTLADCWTHVSSRLKRMPVKLQHITAAAATYKRRGRPPLYWDLKLHTVATVTYQSDNGFYHTGWFSVYRRSEPQDARQWLIESLAALTAQPLRYAGLAAESLEVISSEAAALPSGLTLWSRNGLEGCRELAIPAVSPQLKALGDGLVDEPPALAEPPVTRPRAEVIPLDLREQIRVLARRGYKTQAVLDMLPHAATLARGTVTAIIANAHPNRRPR